CLMARFWLLVVPIQRYRTTVARNYMILPQGHGALLTVSMIIMAGLFIRQRCCPMARSWLREEPKGILFLSRRGARSYMIQPPENGRPPATSMGSALFTRQRCSPMARSSSWEEKKLILSLTGRLTAARKFMIRPPEFGLRLIALTWPAPTTRPRCCPMVRSWSPAASAPVTLVLLIPRSCMIQAQAGGAPPAVSARLIRIRRRRCCRTVGSSSQAALTQTTLHTPLSTPQSYTTHLSEHGTLPAALTQDVIGTQRLCYPTVRFWSQVAKAKAVMS